MIKNIDGTVKSHFTNLWTFTAKWAVNNSEDKITVGHRPFSRHTCKHCLGSQITIANVFKISYYKVASFLLVIIIVLHIVHRVTPLTSQILTESLDMQILYPYIG